VSRRKLRDELEIRTLSRGQKSRQYLGLQERAHHIKTHMHEQNYCTKGILPHDAALLRGECRAEEFLRDEELPFYNAEEP
jgi:hypothetical protein